MKAQHASLYLLPWPEGKENLEECLEMILEK